jgi:spore coat protein A
MWEMVEIDQPPDPLPLDGIVQITMANGKVNTLQRVSRDFKDAANFYGDYNSWEQWSILNVSPVDHPIHIHLIRFQALSRDSYDISGFDPAKRGTSTPLPRNGALPVDPNEQGRKDVIRVGGGQLVRIAGQFGGANGRYIYHCHILVHEDEGMMRTFVVMPKEVMALDPHITHHHALHPPKRCTTAALPPDVSPYRSQGNGSGSGRRQKGETGPTPAPRG